MGIVILTKAKTNNIHIELKSSLNLGCLLVIWENSITFPVLIVEFGMHRIQVHSKTTLHVYQTNSIFGTDPNSMQPNKFFR